MSKMKKNKNFIKHKHNKNKNKNKAIKTEILDVKTKSNQTQKNQEWIALSKIQLASVVLTTFAVTIILWVTTFVALPVSTTSIIYNLKPVIKVAGQKYTIWDFIRDNKWTLNWEEFRNQQSIELLINNEIKNISVSDEEVKKEYDNFIKAYGWDENTVLNTIKKSWFSKDDLIMKITRNVKITKILFDKVNVTEEQVKEYYKTKTTGQTKPKKFEELTEDEKNTYITELKYTKANDEYNGWTQDLLKKANEDKTTQYFDIR